MEQAGLWDNADIISQYTRADAIEDGVLVDLMQHPTPEEPDVDDLAELVRTAGFRWPIAMTAEAFGRYVELSPAAKRAGCDIKGRLWDVLWMMKQAIRRSREGGTELRFTFLCVTERVRPTLCTLKLVTGPDDNGEPCMTIMLPEED